jgi:hypothetical protein
MAHIFNIYKYLILTLICGPILLFAATVNGQDWGRLMVAPEKTNIRATPSLRAKITGQLKPGERVRADFLKNGWYAVFDPEAKKRQKRRARGYVYAPRLVAADASEQKRVKKVKAIPARTRAENGKPSPPKIKTERRTTPEQAVTVPAPRQTASPAAAPGMAQASRQEPASSSRQENVPSSHPEAGLTIKNISVQFEPAGHERVSIDFNQDAAPEIFSIEGTEPRIVIDIHNVQSIRPGLTRINARGRLVRQIRASLDHASRRLRIVVDLAPAMHYEVKPAFFQAEKIYLIDISNISSD